LVGGVERAIGKAPEEEREIRLLLLEGDEEVVQEIVLEGPQAELARERGAPRRVEKLGVQLEAFLERRRLLDERQERLAKAGEVPLRDAGLVAVGIAQALR